MTSGSGPVDVAAAISEHPLPTHAVGEAVGDVLDRIGDGVDVAVVFVTANNAGALEDIAATVAHVLAPATVLGAASSGVVAGNREVDDAPAIAVWAARCGPVAGLRIAPHGELIEVPAAGAPTAAFVLGDPFSAPLGSVAASLERHRPGIVVAGGAVAGGVGPGGSRLLLDGRPYTDGAVGLVFGAEAGVRSVTSQGGRSFGDPYVVTRTDGRRILEMGGRSPIERLRWLLHDLDPMYPKELIDHLHVGIAIDESSTDLGPDDLVVAPIVGRNALDGWIEPALAVEIGQTVRLVVRDHESAVADLDRVLTGARAAGVLAASGTERCIRGDWYADDAERLDLLLPGRAGAGIRTVAEVGWLAGANRPIDGSLSALLLGATEA